MLEIALPIRISSCKATLLAFAAGINRTKGAKEQKKYTNFLSLPAGSVRLEVAAAELVGPV